MSDEARKLLDSVLSWADVTEDDTRSELHGNPDKAGWYIHAAEEVTAALTKARAEGARAMRERVAMLVRYDGTSHWNRDRLARAIEELPDAR